MLNITRKSKEDNLTVCLAGRLDTTTAPLLEKELGNLEGTKTLVFDLENLEYISSAGLRVLLSAQKIMNNQGSMKLVHAKETVQDIFEVTGFSDILTIE